MEPQFLFLFISKPEQVLCGQVCFKEVPESPNVQMLPGGRVPTISSKKEKIKKKERKMSPTKRGVTQSLCLARLSIEATETTAGGGDPKDDHVPCCSLPFGALWV